MSNEPGPSLAEFFGWRHHPFTETAEIKRPFLGPKDQAVLRLAKDFLTQGKSFALTGPAGTGKSTLVRHLLDTLDRHYFRPVIVPYGGLTRGGLLRALAAALGVEAATRAVPLLVTLHHHIQALAGAQNPLHTVVLVDDAQLLARESLLDLCALLADPLRNTVTASLVLVGDPVFHQSLQLHVLAAVRSRLACIFPSDPLNDLESHDFIRFRLEAAQVSAALFDRDALGLVAAHSRGNRRALLNVCTLLLNEAFYRQEKTVGSQLVLACDLLQNSG